MELFMRSTSVVFITVFALLLSACGGEGGVLTQSNQASIANAGIDQTVLANSTVTLDGSASTDLENDVSETSLTYSWLQTDIRNPNEELNNINIATPSFEAPSVTETTVLEFTLTVTDDNEDSSTDIVLITVNVKGTLNDTGITKCSSVSCTGTGEDGEYGRDARSSRLIKVGAGRAGFDFTKLDASGKALDDQALTGSCVQDNHTGLVWEVKTTSGLHNKDDIYTWYNTNSSTNGGADGTDNGGANTQAFVAQVNSVGLCGANDWRLPNKIELLSIVDFATFNPVIDSDYFPNTKSSLYWSSSPSADYNDSAWIVYFNEGSGNGMYKGNSAYVRLVRGGQ
jgi:chitinase